MWIAALIIVLSVVLPKLCNPESAKTAAALGKAGGSLLVWLAVLVAAAVALSSCLQVGMGGG